MDLGRVKTSTSLLVLEIDLSDVIPDLVGDPDCRDNEEKGGTFILSRVIDWIKIRKWE